MHKTDEAALQTVEQRRVEVLPAVAPRSIWHGAFWSALGSALVWASRELLPEVLAACRASRAGIARPINDEPSASPPATSRYHRAAHRQRRGRA